MKTLKVSLTNISYYITHSRNQAMIRAFKAILNMRVFHKQIISIYKPKGI